MAEIGFGKMHACSWRKNWALRTHMPHRKMDHVYH